MNKINIKLTVNNNTIEVNIPVENPDFDLDFTSLSKDFETWIKDYFGMEE